MLKTLAEDYTVILSEEDPALITGDTIFIHELMINNSPLQLGTGLLRTIGMTVTVMSSNGIIHDDVVSDILDRFYNGGGVIYDYSPISGNSNFPFLPADSDTSNPDYVETVYGFMDFIESNATNLLEEEIDRTFYRRTVIEIVLNYAKE
jgi:hypothetical protein